jgi:hypothetical protein
MKRLIAFSAVLLFALAGVVLKPSTSLAESLVTVAAGDEQWDDRFGLPGLEDDDVTAIVFAADGTFYAGGNFTGGVVRWDGRRWQSLGQGLNNAPAALVLDGDILYAIGNFTKAGTVTTKGLAKWDGTAWSRVGNGIGPQDAFDDDGDLYSVAILGDDLIVGGNFTKIDGVTARNIARWDGTTWHALGIGLANRNFEETELDDTGTVYTLTAANGKLYAGGQFDSASNGPNNLLRVNNIAEWDGASWRPLGEGVTGEDTWDNGTIYTIAIGNGAVYVGGDFTMAGGQPAANIARWIGGAWQPLGEGLTGEFDPFRPVEAILIDGTDVYAGGDFDFAGGQEIPRLAMWNGSEWAAVANQIDSFGSGQIHALALSPDGRLFVGGEFVTIDTVLVHNIAFRQDNQWYALGQGLTDFATGNSPGIVYATAIDDDGNVYVGGDVKTAGGIQVSNIAMWDGTGWSSLGSGVDGRVRAMVAVGDDLFVAGEFTKAGSVVANHIARWNRQSQQWSALGSGINEIVYALAYADGILYAGGNFTAAGNVTAYDLAYWDGAAWHAFGNSFRIYERSEEGGEIGTTVQALAAIGSTVIIGGQFQTIHELGTDTQNLANYRLVNNVVGWDRADDGWFYLGSLSATEEPGVTTNGFSGFGTEVSALAFDGNDVYVGGMFNKAGSVAAGNIVRWHMPTNTWVAMAGGVGGLDTTGLSDSPVSDLALVGHQLIVGGYFTAAGNTEARFIALYDTLNEVWSALGSGIAYYNDTYTAVYAVAGTEDSIYVGGRFDKAGGKPSLGIAHWSAPVVKEMITPAGGTLAGDDGVTFQFPNGAVTGETSVSYHPLFMPVQPEPQGQATVRSFRLAASTGGQPVTNLAKPYTIRLPYTDAELHALGAENPNELNLSIWNGAGWTPLLPCAGCAIDSSGHTITVVTKEIGDFVLTIPLADSMHTIYLPQVQK